MKAPGLSVVLDPFGPLDSVGNDNFQGPNPFGFDETQNVALAAALAVDVGTSPSPAGTIGASLYVFFDPGPSQHVIATVDFDSDVLAIITGTAEFVASDFLGNTNHILSSGPGTGQRGVAGRRTGGDGRAPR